MKYIIFKDPANTLHPVMFPDFVVHSQVTIEDTTPVSAGFFDPRTGECHSH